LSVNPTAAAGFDSGAEAYERGRPSYPDEAIAYVARALRLGPGKRVLDLAAGTGKMTRLLVPTGVDLVAVEPVAGMRTAFAAAVPGVEILDGTAEALPLPDRSVDAVVVAQAFHWFDQRQALAEIDRVLKPGGGVALVWNRRDESVPWVADMSRIIHWNRGLNPQYDGFALDGFTKWTCSYVQSLSHDGLLDRVASVSYIAAMDERERAGVLAQVSELVRGFTEPIPLPYVTEVFTRA
jgi:ubiquinone/menaquinone biosynthesis C-methylase UbiE